MNEWDPVAIQHINVYTWEIYKPSAGREIGLLKNEHTWIIWCHSQQHTSLGKGFWRMMGHHPSSARQLSCRLLLPSFPSLSSVSPSGSALEILLNDIWLKETQTGYLILNWRYRLCNFWPVVNYIYKVFMEKPGKPTFSCGKMHIFLFLFESSVIELVSTLCIYTNSQLQRGMGGPHCILYIVHLPQTVILNCLLVTWVTNLRVLVMQC